MNKDQLLGNMKIMLGRLERKLAGLVDNKIRISRAQRLLEDGKVQRTMGEARLLIQRSLRQRSSA